jgi:RHS repeat-associated protein
VTDPAGKWKKYTTDVLGQLLQVNEPNPAGGADYVTTYSYDVLGHLTGVSMPRPTGTQTRTFNYGNPPGAQLLSATNPENGTVSYTYNSYQKVATKTDAAGQQTQYSYDGNARLTQVRHYTLAAGGGSQLGEDTCQQVNYYYDTNPFDGSYSQNVIGRLAAVTYQNSSFWPYYTCDTTFTEMYTYNSAGARTGKRLRGSRLPVNLDGGYTYDNEGKMLTQQYPFGGPNLTYGYDAMGRLQTLSDGTNNVISSTTYGPSGELTAMSGTWGSETRSYNSMLQMTAMYSTSGGVPEVNRTYSFPGSQNNGKISSEYDAQSGETVTYAYDTLNRLAAANGSGWGQSYAYDGFGNLTDITTTAGSTPEWHAAYSAATNRNTNDVADANGNIESGNSNTASASFDVENRMVMAPGYAAQYAYAPDNKRVWKATLTGPQFSRASEEVAFWSVTGQRIATYSIGSGGFALEGTEYYFGGKLVKNAQGMVHADRLGSVGKYFPYGQDRTAPGNGTEKFATYTRDAETGLDYAINRYQAPGQGRFLSPDPYSASAGKADPGSWNRYSYTRGDPANRIDLTGECDQSADTDHSVTVCGESDVVDYHPFGGRFGPGIAANTHRPDLPFPREDVMKLTLTGVAAQNARSALDTFANTNFSSSCASFIDTTFGEGTLAALQGTAEGVTVQNLATVSTPGGSTLFPNNPSLADQEQQREDTATGIVGTTLAQYAAVATNVHAFGQFGGNTIFYNANFLVGIGDGYGTYLMFHEMLHVLGLGGDTQLANAMGVDPAVYKAMSSDAITVKLAQECGH